MLGQISDDFAYSGDWASISSDYTATGLSQVTPLSSHSELDDYHPPHSRMQAEPQKQVIIKKEGKSSPLPVIFAGLGGFSLGAIGGVAGGYFFNQHKNEKV